MGARGSTKVVFNVYRLNVDFVDEYNEKASKYTHTGFTKYLKGKGINIESHVIRHSSVVSEFLEDHKNTDDSIYFTNVIVFQEIDAKVFVEKNINNKVDLIKGIIARDDYYKSVAMSAANIFNANEKLAKKNAELNEKIHNYENEILRITQSLEAIKHENSELIKSNNKLFSTVKEYVYPEIANELLKEQGLIKETAGNVDENVVKKNTLSFKSTESIYKNEAINKLMEKIK